MADKLKEFVNQTFTAADLVGGKYLPLIENDNLTQVTVLDILVDTGVTNVSGILLNNSFEIGGIGTLTGRELVDKDNTLKYELIPAPLPFGTTGVGYRPNDANTYIKKKEFVKGRVEALNVNPGVGAPADVLTLFGSLNSATWIHVGTNYAYYFYHDGNSTTQLWSATVTDGVIGTWAELESTLYSYKDYNEKLGKIQWMNGTTFHSLDAETRIEDPTVDFTAFGANGPDTGVSSYSRACCVNGVFFYFVSSAAANDDDVFAYDAVLNSMIRLTLPQPVADSAADTFSFIYDELTDIYTMVNTDATIVEPFSLSAPLNFSQGASYNVTNSEWVGHDQGAVTPPVLGSFSSRMVDAGGGYFLLGWY